MYHYIQAFNEDYSFHLNGRMICYNIWYKAIYFLLHSCFFFPLVAVWEIPAWKVYGADQYYREVKLFKLTEIHKEQYKKVGSCETQSKMTLYHRCLHTDDEFFLKSMREAIHEILTDVSDSFSNMIDMALANEIRVRNPQL